MLQCKQVPGIIAARKFTVQGAGSTAQKAISPLIEANSIQDEGEQKTTMVFNLLIVLCRPSALAAVLTVENKNKTTGL